MIYNDNIKTLFFIIISIMSLRIPDGMTYDDVIC